MEESKRGPGRPKVCNSASEQELVNAGKQLDAFEQGIKDLTMDRAAEAPVREQEPTALISKRDISNSKDIYLKPEKTISCRDKFNEKFRKDYEFDKEYVNFTASHYELIGDTIEMWTRPYGGMPAEFWKVPSNTPVWGPRYLAEQIKRKKYHRMVMQQAPAHSDGYGQYYGSMAADSTIQRLDAHPISSARSVFMGARNF